MVVIRVWVKGEKGNCYLISTQLLFGKMKRVMEMDGDDGYATL